MKYITRQKRAVSIYLSVHPCVYIARSSYICHITHFTNDKTFPEMEISWKIRVLLGSVLSINLAKMLQQNVTLL